MTQSNLGRTDTGQLFSEGLNLRGTPGDDTLVGGHGPDMIRGMGGQDFLIGEGGNDTLAGGAGDDDIDAGDGDDWANGGSGIDFIDGGAGNDTLFGGFDDDALFGGDGDDDIRGGSGYDILWGDQGSDILSGNGGGDDLFGGAGNDWLFGDNGDDFVSGDDGDDFVSGGNGHDWLIGGSGRDAVYGARGHDVAVFVVADNPLPDAPAATGPDYYDGGRGYDVLRIELTAAEWADVFLKSELLTLLARFDAGERGFHTVLETLNLELRRFEALEIVVDGEVIDPEADTEAVMIDLSSSTEDEVITTASGNDIIRLGSGDDFISTGAGADVIFIGDGDDVVFAGSGNDVIVAGTGGGNDFINGGSGIDTVSYPSIDAGSPLLIDLRPLNRSTNPNAVELLEANGFAADDPVGLATGPDIDNDVLIDIENAFGGTGSDTIFGNDEDNLLKGGADTADIGFVTEDVGDDEIDGGAGHDQIEGLGGNDTLRGGEGDDILIGGAGDDIIDGGLSCGYDIMVMSGMRGDYVFVDLGDGVYQIVDTRAEGDGTDIFSNIDEIVFADNAFQIWSLVDDPSHIGTDGNDTLQGTTGRDFFNGLAGDDLLLGNGGDDFFVGGAGDDVIDGGICGYSIVDYGNDIFDGGLGGIIANFETGIVIDPFGNTDRISGIASIWATDQADILISSDGGNDWVPFGGADTITGGSGFDSLSYDIGPPDVFPNGIFAVFDNVIEGSGTVVDQSGATDTFTGIEGMFGSQVADTILGRLGDQLISGGNGADTLEGGAGFDALTYSGDSSLGGVSGISVDLADVKDDGYVHLTDAFGETDRILGFEQIYATGAMDSLAGDDADNEFYAGAGNDKLFGRGGADTLIGDLGDDTIDGGAGEDYLDGGDGFDRLKGGAGDDYLYGGFDADVFVYEAGDGFDTIEDFALGLDSLELLGGLTITGLSEGDFGGDDGIDTEVSFSSGESLVLLEVSGVMEASELT